METQRWRVTNTTVKPPRIDPDTGRDLRPMIEKRGHSVSFRDSNGHIVLLPQGRSKFIDKLDGGILGLRRGKFISIEEISDFNAALKDHTLDGHASAHKSPQPLADSKQRAKAVEMGEDKYGEDRVAEESSEYVGAKNPDGNPNHVVVAPRGGKKGKKDKKSKLRLDEVADTNFAADANQPEPLGEETTSDVVDTPVEGEGSL